MRKLGREKNTFESMFVTNNFELGGILSGSLREKLRRGGLSLELEPEPDRLLPREELEPDELLGLFFCFLSLRSEESLGLLLLDGIN